MLDENFIEAVSERDIDLLLLEEFHCHPAFRDWMAATCFGPAFTVSSFGGAWHSLTAANLGESDLVALYEDDAGREWAALIENKIDAPPQPRQAARYRERGRQGIAEGYWDHFRTVLVAPAAYLETASQAPLYDVQISYETIRRRLEKLADAAAQPARLRYKARLIREAIAQNRRGYRPVPNEAVTRFWRDYWRYLASEFPRLQMKRPGQKPTGADWPEFSNTDRGRGVKLFHKLRKGAVELQFDRRGERLEELKELNGEILPDDVHLVRAGDAASFQIEVPEVDRYGRFAEQEEAVQMALAAAVRLLDLRPHLRGVERKN